jgi:hypothetical protein
MINKSLLIFISSLIIIFLGIFLADQLGYWSTESSGDFLRGDSEEESMTSPDELRGSSTFGEIESAFDVPAERLAKAYNFDTNEAALIKVMYVSDAFAYLGEDVEMGTGSVKMFIYLYNGLDTSNLEEIENLPSTAVDVLKEDGKWTNESQALMSEYVVTIEKDSFGDEAIADIMDEDVHEEEDEDFSGSLEINGKTTINDIINAGLSLEEIEEELQLEIANVNLGFRDICEQNGLDFSIEKDKILTLVNQ